MEAYKQEKFEVMQRARAYGITMMVGTQDECDIAFFDFKKKLDSFEDMMFEAGAASRDAEIASLKAENESLLKNLRGKHALTGATYAHLIRERDQLREHVKMLRNSLFASANYIDTLGGNSVDSRRNLAATEPKE